MQVISTGIPGLDQLTGIGGYPRGRITELTASEADLYRLSRWMPPMLIVDSESIEENMTRSDVVAFLTPSSMGTAVAAQISALARTHGTTVIFLSTLDQEVPKAVKFWAYLRLRIEDGIASVRKNAFAATQGHSQNIGAWLV